MMLLSLQLADTWWTGESLKRKDVIYGRRRAVEGRSYSLVPDVNLQVTTLIAVTYLHRIATVETLIDECAPVN